MVDSKCWRYFMVFHRMFLVFDVNAAGHGEMICQHIYIACTEGLLFPAFGPMDKNAQLHWTFRWLFYPVFNNSDFCVLWPSDAISAAPRKAVPSRNRRSAGGSRSLRPGWVSHCSSAVTAT